MCYAVHVVHRTWPPGQFGSGLRARVDARIWPRLAWPRLLDVGTVRLGLCVLYESRYIEYRRVGFGSCLSNVLGRLMGKAGCGRLCMCVGCHGQSTMPPSMQKTSRSICVCLLPCKSTGEIPHHSRPS